MSAEPLHTLRRRHRQRTDNSVADPAPVNRCADPVAFSGPDSSPDRADSTTSIDHRSYPITDPGAYPVATVDHGAHPSACRCPTRR